MTVPSKDTPHTTKHKAGRPEPELEAPGVLYRATDGRAKIATVVRSPFLIDFDSILTRSFQVSLPNWERFVAEYSTISKAGMTALKKKEKAKKAKKGKKPSAATGGAGGAGPSSGGATNATAAK